MCAAYFWVNDQLINSLITQQLTNQFFFHSFGYWSNQISHWLDWLIDRSIVWFIDWLTECLDFEPLEEQIFSVVNLSPWARRSQFFPGYINELASRLNKMLLTARLTNNDNFTASSIRISSRSWHLLPEPAPPRSHWPPTRNLSYFRAFQ